jgi:hypothetical protein
LRVGISRARESKNVALFMARHLRDDVGGGAETVNAQPFCIACLAQ